VSTHFTRAILRVPAANFASGITTSSEGAPEFATALGQHLAYADALRSLGLALTILPPDPAHPDSTFVEDTAIVTPLAGILTRPGAASRAGEVVAMRHALSHFFEALPEIEAPGTVDGGDVCETDDGVMIGITARTNEAGARQLASHLEALGLVAELVDIRGTPGLLHLKTGISYLGDGRLAVAAGVPMLPAFRRYECVTVVAEEAYAANCIRVNDRVVVAAGYPRFADTLVQLGYDLVPLEMSEFRKMDGGLSCLSLRF
jgi:dimethylargininase